MEGSAMGERKTYSEDFKAQVVKECQDIGNAALVAKRHGIAPNTVYLWLNTVRRVGSTRPLPRKATERQAEVEKRMERLSSENDQLKKIVAEKELELAILRELRDRVNPHRPTERR